MATHMERCENINATHSEVAKTLTATCNEHCKKFFTTILNVVVSLCSIETSKPATYVRTLHGNIFLPLQKTVFGVVTCLDEYMFY